MQKSFYSSAIAVNNTIAATKLSDLTDTNINTPLNNQILTFSGGKWINANSSASAVQSVFGRVGAVVKNVNDYNITDIQNNSYLASDQNLTVSSPLTGQTIRYDGTKYLNSKLSMDDLSNTNIISPADADSLIYSSAGLGTWKNQKKYAELFNYVNVFAGATVTAVEKTIYFCNLATINFASAASGSIVKVINTNGPLLTMNFSGIILYFNDNNFNATLTTTDACEIVFEKILGNSWQVLSFTGKIFNSITGKNLANNDLNDLRNVSISAPSSGQVISWNGSNFVNSNISFPNYIMKYTNYSALANSTLTAVVNTLYLSNNCTFNMPIGPNAGDIITIFNIEPLTTTTINFGGSNGLYVFGQQNDGPISLSTTEVSAHITFACIDSPTYWFIKDISGEWTNTIIPSKKITAAYIDITNLKNVNISGASTGQILTYNGTNWINSRRFDSFQYNSDTNLTNNNFLYVGYGQVNSETRTQVLLPYAITLTEFNIFLTAAPSLGHSRIFTIRINGAIQATITITNFQNVLSQPINVICTAGQLLSINHINVGANAAIGIFNLKYFYN